MIMCFENLRNKRERLGLGPHLQLLFLFLLLLKPEKTSFPLSDCHGDDYNSPPLLS